MAACLAVRNLVVVVDSDDLRQKEGTIRDKEEDYLATRRLLVFDVKGNVSSLVFLDL